MRQINRLIIHHSASPLTTTIDDLERWHVKERGWSAIGYNAVILAHGNIFRPRRISKTGAHALGANLDSIGLCLVGNNLVAGEEWTAEQVAAGQRYIDAARMLWPELVVLGHRDVPGATTECPGLDVREVFTL